MGLNWTLNGRILDCELRKPFNVLAGGISMAVSEVGRAEWTPLEPFIQGVLGLEPRVVELIRAA